MFFVTAGVSTPTILPISCKITNPKGRSSQKNLAFKLSLTITSEAGVFFKSYPGTGIIGNGTLLYPRLVLKTLFREEVSETYPPYITQTLSLRGKIYERSTSGHYLKIARLIA
jgi:hypothetical protein